RAAMALSIVALALALIAPLTAQRDGGARQGGAQGGPAQGGAAQGGAPQGGTAQGGNRGGGGVRGGGGGPQGRGAQGPFGRGRGNDVQGTSSIRGLVTAGDTNTPLRRAQVTANSPETRSARSATTDATGRFELLNLPAGRWTVTASKGGFVSQQYGQRRAFESV